MGNPELQLIIEVPVHKNHYLHIKNLLRERKYTIEGAKKIMENYAPDKVLQTNSEPESVNVIENEEPQIVSKEKTSLQKDLEEIKTVLELLVSKL